MVISAIELGNQSGCSVGLKFHKAGNDCKAFYSVSSKGDR